MEKDVAAAGSAAGDVVAYVDDSLSSQASITHAPRIGRGCTCRDHTSYSDDVPTATLQSFTLPSLPPLRNQLSGPIAPPQIDLQGDTRVVTAAFAGTAPQSEAL